MLQQLQPTEKVSASQNSNNTSDQIDSRDLLASSRPEDVLLRACHGDLLDEYLTLADAFGFTCADVEAARLRRLLAKQGTTLFDRARVKEFLDRHYVDALWGWRPLRRDDVRPALQAQPSGSDEILITPDVYDKALPLAVLRTGVRIRELFPEARFFVSDARRPNEEEAWEPAGAANAVSVGDPFLAVELRPNGELFIVERWNELGRSYL